MILTGVSAELALEPQEFHIESRIYLQIQQGLRIHGKLLFELD